MAVDMRAVTIKGARDAVGLTAVLKIRTPTLIHIKTHLLWMNYGYEHGNMELTGKATLTVSKKQEGDQDGEGE